MSIAKMQDEFEAWAITCAWLGLSDECMTRDETGYLGLELHAAWLAWQASREALVINAPDLQLCCEDFGVEFIKNIEAVGVKVKS